MPAFAPTFTARLRVRYHAAGRNHVQTWRIPGTGGVLDVGAAVGTLDLFYTALAPIMADDWAHIDTSVAAIDTDIFLPTTSVTIPGGAIAFDPTHIAQKATALSFVGRTVTGGPVKIFQYGYQFVPGESPGAQDFRLYATEDPDLDSAILVLNTAGGSLVGNDGGVAAWYPYANIKSNDHYVKLARQGR